MTRVHASDKTRERRAVAASLALHVGLVLCALVAERCQPMPTRHDDVMIAEVVRPPPPPPVTTSPPPALAPPPPTPPPPRAKPMPPVPVLAPVVQATVPEREPQPAPVVTSSPAPARRVVGLSFAATSSSGGDAFAVGTTTNGTTSTMAEAPRGGDGGSGFRPPRRVHEEKPVYPAALRSQGKEGEVVLEVLVSEDGTIASVDVSVPSGDLAFDAEARRVAALARYEPAVRDGVAVAYRIRFTVRFRLRDAT